MEKELNFSSIEFDRVNIPVAKEIVKGRQDYIPFSINSNDDFFDTITDAYNSSTTNSACIEGISDLIFGKGIMSDKYQNFDRLFESEDVKRVVFDIKLYGSAAIQVYWNDEHTKIIKFYHTPVQNIRAEKIGEIPKVQNYYYCTDWSDYRLVKNKRIIPAFGTSKEKMEILYIKSYTPGLYYYSLPDWYSSLQLSFVESELNNLHYNNVANGFFPSAVISLNNGIPQKEERDQIEYSIGTKFSGTKNSGRFLLMFNNSKEQAAEITPINIDNLHEKFSYVADYATDKILVSHRVTSPLLFGIRTSANGFSSNADELTTAYSIMQTMTINPFQNLIISSLNNVLKIGGYPDAKLYFEQLTPSIILTNQAQATDKTLEQVEDDINEANAVEQK